MQCVFTFPEMLRKFCDRLGIMQEIEKAMLAKVRDRLGVLFSRQSWCIVFLTHILGATCFAERLPWGQNGPKTVYGASSSKDESLSRVRNAKSVLISS